MKFLDIKLIGHTSDEYNNGTRFFVNSNKLNKKARELKEILLIMGGKYQVTDTYDKIDDDGNIIDGVIETSLPWEIYNNL